MIRPYEGGWADYVARRDALATGDAEAEVTTPKKEKPKPRPSRAAARPSELERIEGEIAAREAEIEALEQRLAEDWSDVDVVAAHRRSRDELQTLLARWEDLFERSQA
jgi:hypothetical protein